MITTDLLCSTAKGVEITLKNKKTYHGYTLGLLQRVVAPNVPIKALLLVDHLPEGQDLFPDDTPLQVPAVVFSAPATFLFCEDDFDIVLITHFHSITQLDSLPASANTEDGLPISFTVEGKIKGYTYGPHDCLVVQPYEGNESWTTGIPLEKSITDKARIGDSISFTGTLHTRTQSANGKRVLMMFNPDFVEINDEYIFLTTTENTNSPEFIDFYGFDELTRAALSIYELAAFSPGPAIPPGLNQAANDIPLSVEDVIQPPLPDVIQPQPPPSAYATPMSPDSPLSSLSPPPPEVPEVDGDSLIVTPRTLAEPSSPVGPRVRNKRKLAAPLDVGTPKAKTTPKKARKSQPEPELEETSGSAVGPIRNLRARNAEGFAISGLKPVNPKPQQGKRSR